MGRIDKYAVRLESYLVKIHPALSAFFYVGFVLTTVFIVLVYVRHTNLEAQAGNDAADEKLVLAEIASCRRANEMRSKLNRLQNGLEIYLIQLLRTENLSPDQEAAIIAFLQDVSQVHVPNCEREIRTITERVIEEANE